VGGGGGGFAGAGPERSTPPVSKYNSIARSKSLSHTYYTRVVSKSEEEESGKGSRITSRYDCALAGSADVMAQKFAIMSSIF